MVLHVAMQAVFGDAKPSWQRLQASPADPQSLDAMPLRMLTYQAPGVGLVHLALLRDRALDPWLAIREKTGLSRVTGSTGPSGQAA